MSVFKGLKIGKHSYYYKITCSYAVPWLLAIIGVSLSVYMGAVFPESQQFQNSQNIRPLKITHYTVIIIIILGGPLKFPERWIITYCLPFGRTPILDHHYPHAIVLEIQSRAPFWGCNYDTLYYIIHNTVKVILCYGYDCIECNYDIAWLHGDCNYDTWVSYYTKYTVSVIIIILNIYNHCHMTMS